MNARPRRVQGARELDAVRVRARAQDEAARRQAARSENVDVPAQLLDGLQEQRGVSAQRRQVHRLAARVTQLEDLAGEVGRVDLVLHALPDGQTVLVEGRLDALQHALAVRGRVGQRADPLVVLGRQQRDVGPHVVAVVLRDPEGEREAVRVRVDEVVGLRDRDHLDDPGPGDDRVVGLNGAGVRTTDDRRHALADELRRQRGRRRGVSFVVQSPQLELERVLARRVDLLDRQLHAVQAGEPVGGRRAAQRADVAQRDDLVVTVAAGATVVAGCRGAGRDREGQRAEHAHPGEDAGPRPAHLLLSAH
jgi:hypothetical protein